MQQTVMYLEIYLIIPIPKVFQAAGGDQIKAAGRGTLALLAIDNQIDNLQGAIYFQPHNWESRASPSMAIKLP